MNIPFTHYIYLSLAHLFVFFVSPSYPLVLASVTTVVVILVVVVEGVVKTGSGR
jgi:hypothetical protein